ncbi:MAG: peptidoglycan-associated lipoprotein Pal [Gallionellaceae bacterium]
MNKLAIVLLSLLISACASTSNSTSSPSASNGAAGGGDSANTSASKSTAAQTASAASDAVDAAALEAQQTAAEVVVLKSESVYFDFDQAIIKQSFSAQIQKQADFLIAHANDTVTLEGNCDERGSSEYNLGLGNERARSVAKSLALLGVAANQIKVVSFGEEMPRLTCHEEKCWAGNRRVDFMHELN